MSARLLPPIAGLADISVESRVISTPWSRIVRGIGLGQHPVGYDTEAAQRIRDSFCLLRERVSGDRYTHFASTMTELVLQATNPAVHLGARESDVLLAAAANAVRAIENPYFRVTAGCILLSGVAKLGLDDQLTALRAVAAEVLGAVDEIEPDRIRDENQGRHGDYERVAAWTAVFFAFGQLDISDSLASEGRDRIAEALTAIQNIPTPFFRGRGGSMLISSVLVLGRGDRIFGGDHDQIGSILSYLDRLDELQIYPAFPSRMTPEFVRLYPLLTMLNTIGISGHSEYLTRGGNRLREASELMASITPVERTHMGLYYVMALHNLGRLDTELPDLTLFVQQLVNEWRTIDPGQDYFLNGISYSYLAQIAYFTGRPDLITDQMLDRMVIAFVALERSAQSRANRPYPFSYVLNVLGELGASDRLYTPHPVYGGLSPFRWTVNHMSPGGKAEAPRLYMLNHALISWALRMRPPDAPDPGCFGRFAIP